MADSGISSPVPLAISRVPLSSLTISFLAAEHVFDHVQEKDDGDWRYPSWPISHMKQGRKIQQRGMGAVMKYKTGRIISLSRFVLASVFLLAIYIDPSQPVAAPIQAYLILVFYVAVSLAVMVATWHNWWRDFVLAAPMHLLDLAIFAAVVFSTEGYTSPFFTFSLFLLLSAAIRWGRKETVWSAVAVNVMFLSAGLLSSWFSPTEIDLQRLLIRGTYLLVLSLLFIWYTVGGDRNAERNQLRTHLQGAADLAQLVPLILDHVAARVPYRRLVCLWREGDGRTRALQSEESGFTQLHIPDEELIGLFEGLPDSPFLLDPAAGRMLVSNGDTARRAAPPEQLLQFLRRRGFGGTLAIPARFSTGECNVFVAGIPRLAIDDLRIAADLVHDLFFLHDQALANHTAEEAAAARTRLSIARDLHDSIAQLLAGVSFRLEALKRGDRPITDLAEDFASLQNDLATEQGHIRTLIAELRTQPAIKDRVNVAAHARTLAERLAQQWGIICYFDGQAIYGEFWLNREVQQMIREGVANAVRHGKARRVLVSLDRTEKGMELTIADDGVGLPLELETGAPVQPRSLFERARALGGTLDASIGREGSTIRIVLPAGVCE